MAEGGSGLESGSDAMQGDKPEKENELDEETITKECENVFKKDGIKGLHTLISKRLDAWERIPIKIAVIGRRGVGKSSFINAIRKLEREGEGAAKVGITETTKDVQHYAFPGHENIVLWDLPGVGTPNFRKKEYESKINELIEKDFNGVSDIGSFDFYLILTSESFTEDEEWFVNKVANTYKKKYFFVRTNIKTSIEKDKNGRRIPRSDDTILDEISSECKQSLETEGFKSDNVYLIDNYSPDEFDFQTLTDHIISCTPRSKVDALVFAVSNNSKQIIQHKRKQLEKRLPYAALIALKGSTFENLKDEVTFYKEQFGLTEEAIQSAASELKLSMESFISELGLKSCKLTVLSAYTEVSCSAMESESIRSGFVIAAAVSSLPRRLCFIAIMSLLGLLANEYKKKYDLLCILLKWCAEDAIKIQEALCKSVITGRKYAPSTCDKLSRPDINFM